MNKALKIALFFGVFQGAMLLMGWSLGLSFREPLSKIDHWVAFSLLCFLGGKLIYKSFQIESNLKSFNPLDFYILLGLVIATSINALAVGIVFLLLKISILLSASVVSFIIFCSIYRTYL